MFSGISKAYLTVLNHDGWVHKNNHQKVIDEYVFFEETKKLLIEEIVITF